MPPFEPVVVPVRFVLDGRAWQTTSRHLAIGGVTVRTQVRPRLGAELFLKLYMPGSHLPEEVLGAVRHVETAEGEEGFFAEFIMLPQGVRQKIAALLDRSRIGNPERDTRAHPRHLTRIRVRFATAREFVVRYAYDISAGGLFVSRPEPFPLGEVVKLSLELPDGSPPIAADAVVVRCVTAEQAEASGKEAGNGLQFAGGNDELRARLDAFIERLAREPCWDEEPDTVATAPILVANS